ncbi:hypothetical protein [Hugonella massiliensis]|uniref:hypothetical protein n=1 Tax=Hugonella massiliensis TaxID=1720315 RepID=UPI00073E51D1|nr:hypothetical protein [Hugonella massiliensis]
MKPISGRTKLITVIGDPIEHSLSPQIHNRALEKDELDYRYLAFDILPDQVPAYLDAMRTMGIVGTNVTMPDKRTVFDNVDAVDPVAALVGACNTVVNDHGKLIGYTTDGYGFMKTFESAGIPVAGRKFALLGMGGAGTAVAAQAAVDGVGELVVFNRANGRSWATAEVEIEKIREATGATIRLCDLNDRDLLRHELATTDFLANTTPIGMAAQIGLSPVPDVTYFHPGMVVQDAIYAPEETELLRLARLAGCTAFNGKSMLFWQASRSYELWLGHPMPITIEEAYA